MAELAVPRRTVVVATVLAVSLLAACASSPSKSGSGAATDSQPASATDTETGTGGGGTGSPNVVFVLTDDLSADLVDHMPNVQRLAKDGANFTNYSVTDSLCCPSRSSIFSGRFPHDTGVFTNTGNDGGFETFHGKGEEANTFATALQSKGYRTAMMGKYLNGYEPKAAVGGQPPYVPPGWNEWDVAGNGYKEFDYDMAENHKVVHHGHAASDYLTDVVSAKGSTFIKDSASGHHPFLLEVATFAPHGPYTPAPRDANSFPGLKLTRGPAYDTLPSAAPSWLASRKPLTPKEQTKTDDAYRKRVQAVQAVDQMIGSLRTTLEQAGVAKNTLVVFSSDNGYHMGQHRLTPGKMTAFDTDIRVPLVAAGPGVPAGRTVAQPAENIDLAPTFEELAGAAVPSMVDGQSLVPLLHGQEPTDWRTAALVEHHGPDFDGRDPDKPGKNSGNPTTYEALRTSTATYVEYANGEREYYDRTTDPDELHNTVAQLPADQADRLHRGLAALHDCHGGESCWSAGHLPT